MYKGLSRQLHKIAMTVKNKQKSIKLKTTNTRRKKGEQSEILKKKTKEQQTGSKNYIVIILEQ